MVCATPGRGWRLSAPLGNGVALVLAQWLAELKGGCVSGNHVSWIFLGGFCDILWRNSRPSSLHLCRLCTRSYVGIRVARDEVDGIDVTYVNVGEICPLLHYGESECAVRITTREPIPIDPRSSFRKINIMLCREIQRCC